MGTMIMKKNTFAYNEQWSTMFHHNANKIAILFHNTTIYTMQQLLRCGLPHNL